MAIVSPVIRFFQKLEFRQRLGLRGVLGYDRYRNRILAAKPVPHLGDDRAEVHIITSKPEWINAAWGLYSFYRFSGETYRLCIHEDGSLDEEAVSSLKRLFPGSRVIRYGEATEAVTQWLEPFPRCQLLRKTKFISMKEFDFNYYLEAPIGILFDSDLIFYRRPDFVCDELIGTKKAGNWVNRDVHPGLSMPASDIESKFGFSVPEQYNTGFGTWHEGSIRNEDLEAFLADLQVLDHPWRFEQTLHALCSGRSSAHLLPPEYDVYWGPLKDKPVMRHYVGAIRHQMFSEGMYQLAIKLLG